jgi:hypothetical protein
MWLTALFEAIKSFFDNLLPWSKRWAEKETQQDKDVKQAQANMDEAVKKGDWHEMDNSVADRDNA